MAADRAVMGAGSPAIRPARLRRAGVAWVGMVVIAILNATVREVVVTPRVGEYWAHVTSTATLLGGLAIAIGGYLRVSPAHRTRELWAIGIEWASLTIAFELLFGHYVAGESWAALADQYDITAGRVWIAVPAFLIVAPRILARLVAGRREGEVGKP